MDVISNWLGQDKWEAKGNTGSPSSILVLRDVQKVYKTEFTSTFAVNNVSFQIPRSSFVGIMGASGSGKTTLLNLIATIDKPTSGVIEIDGQNIADISEKNLAKFRREHLGFVFQEYNLLETLTIYENIALALTVKEVPKASYCDKILFMQDEEIKTVLDREHETKLIAQMTTASAVMSGVFCICLIFSAMSFVFGTLMLQQEVSIFDVEIQRWMGFLQISLCIIFVVIYFSILSLQQIIEFKQRAKDVQLLHLLHYIGKDSVQIKKLIRNQILTKFSLPTVMCAVPLLIAMPLVNNKLNTELPAMQNIVLKSVGWFLICFLILYLCYFFVARAMCKKYVEDSINSKI